MAKLLRHLRPLPRILAIVGVIIAYANLKDWFVDSDRLHVYNALTNRQKLTVVDKGVKKFLDDHFYTLKLPSEMATETIDGLTAKWIAIGDNRPMSGTVHVKFESGKRTAPMCTFEELRAWAYETPFYAWLGWWLLFIGVAVETLIDLIEAVRKRRKSQTVNG